MWEFNFILSALERSRLSDREVATSPDTWGRFGSIKKLPLREFNFILSAGGRSRTGTWGEPHQILSLARLPISSHRQVKSIKLSILQCDEIGLHIF